MRCTLAPLLLALASATMCLLEEGMVTVPDGRSSQQSVNVSALPRGPYTVKTGKISKVPGLKDGGDYGAEVVYAVPRTAGEKLPFISFAHGMGAGNQIMNGYSENLELVASYGFVIVAVHSCPTTLCLNFHEDQLQTIVACKADPTLHPALASVDFSKVGIYGHSMGAMATVGNAGAQGVDPSQYNIKAAVSEHPCWNPSGNDKAISAPILLTTGTVDSTCADMCSKNTYGRITKSPSKILFNIKGADHLEPCNGHPKGEVSAVAYFLSCWVRDEHCDKVYGSSGQEICNVLTTGETLSECTVSGTKEMPAMAV